MCYGNLLCFIFNGGLPAAAAAGSRPGLRTLSAGYAIAQVRMAHGMIKLSRVVAIILALLAFCIFIVMIIGFIILPLFGQMNEFLQKLPALAAKSNIQDLDSMLKDPSTIRSCRPISICWSTVC